MSVNPIGAGYAVVVFEYSDTSKDQASGIISHTQGACILNMEVNPSRADTSHLL